MLEYNITNEFVPQSSSDISYENFKMLCLINMRDDVEDMQGDVERSFTPIFWV